MKNKSSRLLVALVPFVATLFIWGTWETKFSPWVDKIYDAKPDLINFHKVMDEKITKGELTKDQAIIIYKRNALDGQEADEEIAGLFKVIVMFSFLSLFVCMLVSSIRVIVLEIKSDWKLYNHNKRLHRINFTVTFLALRDKKVASKISQ